jgi:hypothetical protein
MRVRADSVLIASALHTIALLYLIRPALWDYSGRKGTLLEDAGFREAAIVDELASAWWLLVWESSKQQ